MDLCPVTSLVNPIRPVSCTPCDIASSVETSRVAPGVLMIEKMETVADSIGEAYWQESE